MPKIAIDIDNTICETSKFFGNLAIKYDREVLHKKSVINFDKVVPRSDEWTKEELAFFIENFFNKETINIPVKNDVSLYINKLKKDGYTILFLTNRGIKEDDHSDLVIPEYLKKNDIPYDNIITKSNDKYNYLQDCDYFVDDDVHNCEEALEKSKTTILLMATPKTNDYKNDKIIKVKNWEEVYNFINSYESKKESHLRV